MNKLHTLIYSVLIFTCLSCQQQTPQTQIEQTAIDFCEAFYNFNYPVAKEWSTERKLQMELLNKLCHMIAVHQPMMAGYGNGHHQSFSITEVLSGGDFGNTVARTHIGGVLHVGE